MNDLSNPSLSAKPIHFTIISSEDLSRAENDKSEFSSSQGRIFEEHVAPDCTGVIEAFIAIFRSILGVQMSPDIDSKKTLMSTAAVGAALVGLSLLMSQPHSAMSRDSGDKRVIYYHIHYGNRLGHNVEGLRNQLKKIMVPARFPAGAKHLFHEVATSLYGRNLIKS